MTLICKGLSKSYGSVQALKNADITVEKGEIKAILGGNGSGKSTLAKIIGSIIERDAGDITWDGREVCLPSPKAAKKAGFVITSQELSLFNNLTVEENLMFCALPRGWFRLDRRELRHRAAHYLDLVGLGRLAARKPNRLAPNEQYMIEFAKALAQDPKVLVIDEITSALYREDVELVRQLLHDLKNNGKSVLFISHRMSELYSICDSVTVMRNGETVADYPMQEKDELELLSIMSNRNLDSIRRHHHGHGGEPDAPPLVRVDRLPIPAYRREIAFKVGAGEVVGVAGLQGHGQSDLVRSLFGINGEVAMHLDGEEVAIASPHDAVRHSYAFISGDREKEGAFSERSLAENLSAVTGLVKGEAVGDPDEVLDRYGVYRNNPRQLITSLSGGNQQKVIVGRWLSSRPKLLLADDPTKGIDVSARADLHKLFCEMAAQGSGVVMVSSDDEELVALAEKADNARVIVMYEGGIAATLRGDAITSENIAAASMPSGKIEQAV